MPPGRTWIVSHSSVFAATPTRVLDGTLVKVLASYDPAWGYACRMLDADRDFQPAK